MTTQNEVYQTIELSHQQLDKTLKAYDDGYSIISCLITEIINKDNEIDGINVIGNIDNQAIANFLYAYFNEALKTNADKIDLVNRISEIVLDTIQKIPTNDNGDFILDETTDKKEK